MSSREEQLRNPQGELESPFLDKELFVREAETEWEAHLVALETESPFWNAFEANPRAAIGPELYQEEPVEEDGEDEDESFAFQDGIPDEEEEGQEEGLGQHYAEDDLPYAEKDAKDAEEEAAAFEIETKGPERDSRAYDSELHEGEGNEKPPRLDLGVTAKQVAEYHWAFRGRTGRQFKELIEWAANEVSVDPGLLATNLIAEARRSVYFRKGRVSSFEIGADDFYEKRRDIAEAVPAYSKVRWDEKQAPFIDTNETGRKVKTIFLNSGRDALLASAVYLKHGEVVLRDEAARFGGDLGKLPVVVRLALTRLAFNAGHGRAKKNLREALKGQDILIRRKQAKAGPQRRATILAARAMHLSQRIFGKSAKEVPGQEEVEEDMEVSGGEAEIEGIDDEQIEEDYLPAESPHAEQEQPVFDAVDMAFDGEDEDEDEELGELFLGDSEQAHREEPEEQLDSLDRGRLRSGLRENLLNGPQMKPKPAFAAYRVDFYDLEARYLGSWERRQKAWSIRMIRRDEYRKIVANRPNIDPGALPSDLAISLPGDDPKGRAIGLKSLAEMNRFRIMVEQLVKASRFLHVDSAKYQHQILAELFAEAKRNLKEHAAYFVLDYPKGRLQMIKAKLAVGSPTDVTIPLGVVSGSNMRTLPPPDGDAAKQVIGTIHTHYLRDPMIDVTSTAQGKKIRSSELRLHHGVSDPDVMSAKDNGFPVYAIDSKYIHRANPDGTKSNKLRRDVDVLVDALEIFSGKRGLSR